MLEPPMAKRHRTRPRSRRGIEAARRASAPARVEREEAPVSRPVTHRPVRTSRAGSSRAVGAPSASLEKAAVVERNFIAKDFRRLGLVVGVGLVVLIGAGLLESTLVK